MQQIFLHKCAYVNSLIFEKKRVFLELPTFFIPTTSDIYTKMLYFSENSVKIKVKLHWEFFITFLMSAIICKSRFCLETRLSNFFKAAYAMMLTETILESTYKICV